MKLEYTLKPYNTDNVFMKSMIRYLTGMLSLLLAAFNLQANPVILERGQNHRIIQVTKSYTDEYGSVVTTTNQVTHLETGIHYLENGRWEESQDLIEPDTEGAVAQRGPYKVRFYSNLNTPGAIDILLPGKGNKHLRGNVLGLALTDVASGKTIALGEVQDSIGQILPPNQILYTNAFKGIAADMRYIYRKGQFEADVILHEQPILPAGFDPKTTRLQVITEFLDSPQAKITEQFDTEGGKNSSNNRKLSLSFQDHTINFGPMVMTQGRAFSANTLREKQNEDSPNLKVPVAKSWQQTADGRSILVESVEYESLVTLLQGLPKQASLLPPKRIPYGVFVPTPHHSPTSPQPMEIARVSTPQHGTVIDYVLVVSQAAWTFNSSQTYLVNGSVWIDGSMTIYGGSVIKYALNARLMVSGNLYCYASSANKAILTAVDDNSVGESIGSGFPSGYYADDAINLYNVQTGSVLTGLQIRYAQDGIYNYSPYGPHYVDDCEFLECQRGVVGYWTTIYLNNDTMCNVGTSYWNDGNAYFYVSGLNSLPGTGDYDEDALSNKEEMLRLSSPLNANSQSEAINDSGYFMLAKQNGPTRAKLTELVILQDGRIRLKLEYAEIDVPYDIYLATSYGDYWRWYYSGPADNGATGPTRYYTVTHPGTQIAFFMAGSANDVDNDDMPDGFESIYIFSIVGNADSNNNGKLDADEDPDGDGYSNRHERALRWNPLVPDTVTVEVTNIKFNHDPNSTAHDAVNIADNYTLQSYYNLLNGEWVKGALNQPACYVANRPDITIRARFTVSSSPSISSAEIQAVSIGDDGSLGNIGYTTVNFVNGVSDPEYVTLSMSGSTANCVQKADTVIWLWKVKNLNDCGTTETNMNASGPHLIYTILNDPQDPTTVVWVNPILDLACQWATGAQDGDVASANILSQGFRTSYTWDYNCHRLASDFIWLTSAIGIPGTLHYWSSYAQEDESEWIIGDMMHQYTWPFTPVGKSYGSYDWDWHQWAETTNVQRDPSAALSCSGTWGDYEDYLFDTYDYIWDMYFDGFDWYYEFDWQYNQSGQSVGCENEDHRIYDAGHGLIFEWLGPN